MNIDPRLICSYPRASDALGDVMKYGISLQPSNPHNQEFKDALFALYDAMDRANDWEKLNPDQDEKSQLDIGRQEYWIKKAEQGIFTEEQDTEDYWKKHDEAEERSSLNKKWLEGLLGDENE